VRELGLDSTGIDRTEFETMWQRFVGLRAGAVQESRESP
jgi:hypothetical protein